MELDSMPLVTIAIPTYNRANSYLKGCVESAVRQTYPAVEIIISDNCSVDDTEALISKINDPRIRYFKHSKNIGANNNFNFCVKQATGDYFHLLHDDDLIDSDFVSSCMDAAGHQKGFGIIRTGTRLIDSKGRIINEILNDVIGLSNDDFFLGWFKHKTSPYLCSTLFNTEALKGIGGFQSRHNLFQDVMAEVQLAAKHGRKDVKWVKASFRKHPDEMTFSAKVKDWCEDSIDLLNLIGNLAQKKKEIQKNGIVFFCNLNFNRAMAVSSPIDRFKALLTVLFFFKFRFFAVRRFIACLRHSLVKYIGLDKLKKINFEEQKRMKTILNELNSKE